jgi:prevent-host-death family protein
MAEMYLSASEFRVRLKDLANHVARGGEPIIVSRHGLETFVMVSLQDYLRWSKDSPRKRHQVPEDHPDDMAEADVERLHNELKDSDDPVVQRWCDRALLSLTARRWHRKHASTGPPS